MNQGHEESRVRLSVRLSDIIYGLRYPLLGVLVAVVVIPSSTSLSTRSRPTTASSQPN